MSELQKFADMAKEFITKSEAALSGERTRISRVADWYKIPTDLIFSDSGPMPEASTEGYEPTSVPGVRRRKR